MSLATSVNQPKTAGPAADPRGHTVSKPAPVHLAVGRHEHDQRALLMYELGVDIIMVHPDDQYSPLLVSAETASR